MVSSQAGVVTCTGTSSMSTHILIVDTVSRPAFAFFSLSLGGLVAE